MLSTLSTSFYLLILTLISAQLFLIIPIILTKFINYTLTLYTAMDCCIMYNGKSYVTQILYSLLYFGIHLNLVCGNSWCRVLLNYDICKYLLLG